jgi:hypothetical protein
MAPVWASTISKLHPTASRTAIVAVQDVDAARN